MNTYSNTLAWKIPWMEEPGGLQLRGSLRVGHDWATSLSLFTFMHWRRKWQPTSPVLYLSELLKFMSIESVMASSHLVLCHHFLLLPSLFPSIRVYSSELALCIRWPKYWVFSFSPSSEYSEFVSFRIDRFDRLVVQGTLKSLLQHLNSFHQLHGLCPVSHTF